MKAASVAFAVAAIAAAGLLAPAHAQERMVPLAVSGEWASMAHQPSMIERPDVCITMNVAKGFAIRAGEGAIQVRIWDHSWSLPTGVEGAIAISVGDLRQALYIGDNTDTMVNAEIERVDAVKLLDAMDKASVLTFTVGKAKPVAVSLAGSTIVTNAFRTCAGLRGSTAAPGGNPFE